MRKIGMESKDPSRLGEAEKLVETVLNQAKIELEKKEEEENDEANGDPEEDEDVKKKLLDETQTVVENGAEDEAKSDPPETCTNGHPVNGAKNDAENGKNGVNGKEHANGDGPR